MSRDDVIVDRRSSRGRRSAPRVPALVLACAAVVLIPTVLIALVPGLAFGARAPELHVGIETAASGIALLAAYLVVGRYQLSGSLVALALVGALALLALGNVAFSTVPAVLGSGDSALTTWGPAFARLLSAGAFVAAALVADIRLASPRRAGLAMLLGVSGAVALVALGVAAFSGGLAASFGVTGDRLADAPGLGDAPLGFVVLQAATLVLFAAAAVGFARRAARSHDELLGWIAAAMALAAVARVDYLLFPAAATDWVFAGDFARLASFLVLLAGALREIRSYQRDVSVAAVLDERRRVARELHDGLAQELAYINMQSQRLELQGGGPEVTRLVEASRRALDESRQAIEALSRRSDEPFGATVSKVAEQLAGRAGARLRLDIDSGIEVAPDVREQLLRIVREAVTNGVRHGEADEIALELSNGDGLRLCISDNGHGFDAGGAGGGFGLVSMRERVASLGGEIEVRSNPAGTRVEVTLP